MVRRSVFVLVALILACSGHEALAWPSPANWGCGWYGSVRPSYCNVGLGCGPRFYGPAFCGPAWGWCGPRFYGVSGWSVGGLNFTSQGFSGPGFGWGGWAPAPFPFVARPRRTNLLIAARPAPQGFGLAARSAPALLEPADPSSATQPAESIASIRARRQGAPEQQLAAASPVADELAARADRALAAGKPGVARLYLQMAIAEAAGPRRDALRARLAGFDRPADPARVAGEGAAVR
jgi:hypothetical protein